MPAPSSASAPALRGRQEKGNRYSMSGSQNTEGHGFRDCPHTIHGNRDVLPQDQTASALAPVAHPAPTHGASSSTASGLHQNRFYALPSRQEQKDSPDVVTVRLEIVSEPILVSTPVDCRSRVVKFQFPGESVIKWSEWQ
ncbi:uncharacterized protein LOC124898482 [Capsicum annuum]|uniref:uncharacterized protein LOC124898482 n=1 Tax=Capsicum annuum TaxID=4072 RepID=UPI001FB0D203|nr:uncharacterized protein LOC124898482 [Capsicum annuum]